VRVEQGREGGGEEVKGGWDTRKATSAEEGQGN
jgi:hypothetical protein